jgi:predicted Zn-ribbon and HTH transcriptional regulator
MTRQRRLRILSEDEIKIIYDRPCFTYEGRCHYFALSQPEKELLRTLRSIKSKAYFVLQLGYFKTKKLFYTFDLHEVREDLQYILKEHFNNEKITNLRSIEKLTRLNQQGLILQLFHYRSCGAEERKQLEEKAYKAATFCGKPIYIFRELMNYLSEQRIIVPGYSFMQEIVGQAITHEQNRLVTLMQNHLKQVDKEALEQLLEDSSGLYEITLLKREQKDFSATEIKREMDRGKQIQPLYHLAQELLPRLGISNESIKYYASLVTYYSVFRLKRLNKWIAYVYLLCFVHHRYQRMHDNLINTFLFSVQRYTDEAKQKAKERVYDCYTESNQNMGKAGEVLKLFTDEGIPPHTPFQDIRERAFAILERQKLASIANQITTDVKFDETAFQWEHIDQMSQKFKRYL